MILPPHQSQQYQCITHNLKAKAALRLRQCNCTVFTAIGVGVYVKIKHKMKKYIFVIVAVLVAAGAFYGGQMLGKSQVSAQGASRNLLSGGQNFQRGMGRNGGAGGGFISGQIIAKDSQSITVEFRNSSSTSSANSTKIIFFSGSTPITKSVNGTADDLAVGVNVSIIGTANSDGSITAQSIQVRPTPPANQAGQ